MSEFLGKGWAFPPKFDLHSKSVNMAEGKEDIEQSLRILFSTTAGERIMLPEFGSDLNLLMFEQINTTLKTYVTHLLTSSILLYESRIEIDAITIDDTDWVNGLLRVSLSYFIKSTNSRHNLVYPFYLEEGTHARIT